MISSILWIAVAILACVCAGVALRLRNWLATVWCWAALGMALALAHQAQTAGRPSYAERQRIAVEFMCGPGQHWKGMSMFCGAQVLDGAAAEQRP